MCDMVFVMCDMVNFFMNNSWNTEIQAIKSGSMYPFSNMPERLRPLPGLYHKYFLSSGICDVWHGKLFGTELMNHTESEPERMVLLGVYDSDSQPWIGFVSKIANADPL